MDTIQRTKVKEMEGKEEALLKRIDDLSTDQLEMSEAIDTLKRWALFRILKICL